MPIRPDLPPEPDFGSELSPVLESAETLKLLALRKSTPAGALTGPGPGPDDIDQIIRLAMRVPDHRKLEPWRFVVFDGPARAQLGDIFASALRSEDVTISETKLAEARALPMRAPVVIAAISSPVDDPKRTPVWEQELSAGAVCQTLMLAAFASGWAACWLTEWPAYNAAVARRLGLAPNERFAGFIYLGTAKEKPVERARPSLAMKVRRWGE
jgi:nitroreductase